MLLKIKKNIAVILISNTQVSSQVTKPG